ncbi:MAG: carboxypeptidase regulatory-like domain-containing protein [Acidobacteria bacterium]|nr:carboxypeptidase regulatory-like domain-containing protein [Acidobacteriota bacterium]
MEKIIATIILVCGLAGAAGAAPGELDPLFNGTGKSLFGFGTGTFVNAMAVQPDGKIIVAGYTNNFPDYDFALMRFNFNGTLDPTFGTGGLVVTSLGTSGDHVYAVAVQPDGKIVAAGDFSNNAGIAVVRYNPNGTLDTSFDTDGKVTTVVGTGFNNAQTVAIQPDGKIVAAGVAVVGQSVFGIVRYNPDGSLDTSFDADGKVTTAVAGSSSDTAKRVRLQPDGKIVVAGTSSRGAAREDFVVARYNANGALDPAFGTAGVAAVDFGSSSDQASSFDFQSDGKIVVAGFSIFGSSTFNFAVARLNANGTPDTTFDGDGRLTTANGVSINQAKDVAVQVDGKIVVAGTGFNGLDNDLTIVRYNPDGSLDNSFAAVQTSVWGAGGRSIIDAGGNEDGRALGLDAAGRALVAGTSNSGGLLVRLQSAVPTAAGLTLGGSVRTAKGAGIAGVRVRATNAAGVTQTAVTNSFGFYRFSDIAAGETLILSAAHRKYAFAEPTRVVTVDDALTDVDFTAFQ